MDFRALVIYNLYSRIIFWSERRGQIFRYGQSFHAGFKPRGRFDDYEFLNDDLLHSRDNRGGSLYGDALRIS